MLYDGKRHADSDSLVVDPTTVRSEIASSYGFRVLGVSLAGSWIACLSAVSLIMVFMR